MTGYIEADYENALIELLLESMGTVLFDSFRVRNPKPVSSECPAERGLS